MCDINIRNVEKSMAEELEFLNFSQGNRLRSGFLFIRAVPEHFLVAGRVRKPGQDSSLRQRLVGYWLGKSANLPGRAGGGNENVQAKFLCDYFSLSK